MLIDLKEVIKKYNLSITGIIQCGAHFAEENDIYKNIGVQCVVYIEPCEKAFYKMICNLAGEYAADIYLKEIPESFQLIAHLGDRIMDIYAFKVACADREGVFDMYVSNDNQGQSNSLLEPNLHMNQHPEIIFNEKETVNVCKLDNLPIDKSNYDTLVMDVQGAEGMVLKGATETLKHINCIYTEVNRDYTYEENMLIEEMDLFLSDFGFRRVETYWPSPNWSWGDAVYIKNNL